MFEQINKAAKELRDPAAGWVTRRDAAEFLGRVASAALSVLHGNRDEMDVDVRRVIEKALAEASAGLAGIAPKTEQPATLAELVKACEKKGARTATAHGNGFVIEVSLKSGRKQRVCVTPFRREDGIEFIRVYTFCGTPSGDATVWALRANTKITQGALALDADAEGDRLVLTNCLLASDITPAQLKTSVKEIAYYGDWVEGKLTGADNL